MHSGAKRTEICLKTYFAPVLSTYNVFRRPPICLVSFSSQVVMSVQVLRPVLISHSSLPVRAWSRMRQPWGPTPPTPPKLQAPPSSPPSRRRRVPIGRRVCCAQHPPSSASPRESYPACLSARLPVCLLACLLADNNTPRIAAHPRPPPPSLPLSGLRPPGSPRLHAVPRPPSTHHNHSIVAVAVAHSALCTPAPNC